MPYKRILKELVERTPQAVGAVLVDWEGEAVQEFCHCDPYDIRFIGAHEMIILSRFREAHKSGLGGVVEEVVVSASGGFLIIGAIDQEYSLVMSIGRDCPLGLSLHHFRTAIGQLKKEI
jgi:predicted regulator of Ras-like GTPase activity (Roadblock/LC7/MglB family)